MKITSCKEQIEFETLYFLQFGQRFWHKGVLNNSCHFLVYLPVQQSRARFFAPCATETQHEIGIKKKKKGFLGCHYTNTNTGTHTHTNKRTGASKHTHTLPREKVGAGKKERREGEDFREFLLQAMGTKLICKKLEFRHWVGVETSSWCASTSSGQVLPKSNKPYIYSPQKLLSVINGESSKTKKLESNS